jgi:hypothetical protein
VAGGNQIALLPDGFVSFVVHSDIRRIFRHGNFVPSRAAGIEEQLLDPANLIGLDVVNQFANRESLNHKPRSYADPQREASFCGLRRRSNWILLSAFCVFRWGCQFNIETSGSGTESDRNRAKIAESATPFSAIEIQILNKSMKIEIPLPLLYEDPFVSAYRERDWLNRDARRQNYIDGEIRPLSKRVFWNGRQPLLLLDYLYPRNDPLHACNRLPVVFDCWGNPKKLDLFQTRLKIGKRA